MSGVLMLLRALMTLLPKEHRLAGDLKDLFARGKEIDAKDDRTGEIGYEDDDLDHAFRPSPERTATQRPPLQNGTDGAADVRSILNF